MEEPKRIKRAFKITVVQYEDDSLNWQVAEKERWDKLELATVLQCVHDRLIKDVEESMHEAVDDIKKDLGI